MSEKTTKDRIMAGAPETEGDLSPEEVLAQATTAAKDRWIGIFVQLANSHRFNKFLEDNYIIQDRIDAEKQTIETLVIERPIAVGPALSSAQLTEMQTLLKLSKCQHPEGVFEALLKLLGQDGPSIILANGEALNTLKNKLDA